MIIIRKYVNLIILLILSCAIISCVVRGSSQTSLSISSVLQDTCGETHSGADNCRGRKMNNEIFVVKYDQYVGFELYRPNELGEIDILDLGITARFNNDAILREFEQFVSQENLRLIVGKKIYCNCIGEHYEINSYHYYKIHKAHLYAK